MKTLIINPLKQSDLRLIVDIAKRLGLPSRILSSQDSEDIGLLKAMLEGKKTKLVSKSSVVNKLQS